MIPGTDLCQVVENTRNDIRLLNAAVRRLGDHPYRTTALCTDRNIDTEHPFHLQPPFFDMAADDAVNYGAIGAVIGHEIGHGLDDSGSAFDGNGSLRNWARAPRRRQRWAGPLL
jgi:hypothetical protein